MLLPMIDVILLGAWLLISVVEHAYYLYLTGNGLWNEMKWSYIFSTVFNLIMNIVLGKMLGITGIILASMLSVAISGLIWQCLIVFKCYFRRSPLEYFIRQAIYFIVAFAVCGITYNACTYVVFGGWLGLLFEAGICICLPAVLFWIIYRKTEIFKSVEKFVLKVVRNK
jgi:O-antigen/teichoic acid export membrane protein